MEFLVRFLTALALIYLNQAVLGQSLGGVACESSVCSQIGADLIAIGGNAADAMVGTVFCVGVIGMYNSGIGGGGFMLVRASNGTYEFIDFRDVAPAAAFQEMYKDNVNGSIYGGLASAVPGEVKALHYLHTNYGKLPWDAVMRPAIDIARNGFSVTGDLVDSMDRAVVGISNFLVEDPTWAMDFAPNGTRVGLGDIMTRKRYADTLEQIAQTGPDAFYTGSIARTTVAALQKTNGTMTLKDLKDYKLVIRKPARIDYRDFKLTAGSAPSSGEVVLSVMKVIEGYRDIGEPATVNLSTHRLVEAVRFGYGQRAELGDPAFVPYVNKYQLAMVSNSTAARTRARISDYHTLAVDQYDPELVESLDPYGTSHMVAADRSDMAISLTTTVNLLFGSHLQVPETGIIMNNGMNDFSIPDTPNAFGYNATPSNYIRPGKRPLSSISPVIVEHRVNSSLYFLVGAGGGSRIITAVIQTLWHTLDQQLDPKQALNRSRLHDQLIPNRLEVEYSYNNATVAFLRGRGHNVTWLPVIRSRAQAIRLLTGGIFEAAGEPREANAGGVVV